MLLIHQSGSVKIGEVVRYTITYTPSSDRILPSPSHLYVRIKNTSAVPLRAAYLRGPYILHVCSYPSTFNPNQKLENPKRDGVPDFEPGLKAGGHWHTKVTVPEDIRETGEKANSRRHTDGSLQKCTWIVEIASQIMFSNNAAVHYELLVGRDERSLDLGFAAIASKGHGEPGSIKDFQHKEENSSSRSTQPKGVYSKAIELVVEDTTTLWGKPPLPQWGDEKSQLPTDKQNSGQAKAAGHGPKRTQKPKKLHLVVVTHGLHSNMGADMLYLKESIDAAASEARHAARERRRALREQEAKKKDHVDQSNKEQSSHGAINSGAKGTAPVSGGQDRIADDEEDEDSEDDDDEQVIVRGFSGNACRTDRGIQYLGKRLAKFVLTTTYPDQPFLPASKSRSLAGAFGAKTNTTSKYGPATHHGSSIHRKDSKEKLPYTFTSISFVGHSLGGLVQIYAAAYIHKHSPGFFDQIKPQNLISMATPLLGLNNENPLYVKFALDFGLVGRTGQDLGLTWRAPTIARSGWSAVMSGFSGNAQNQTQEGKQSDPYTKPLLRILPTGPAHQVLKMFKNRTLYANIVNDGIVPLRTSSLLFLDWRGLEKVDNARRQNGLIGTMAALGWAELTGASTTSHRPSTASTIDAGQQSERKDDPAEKMSTSPQASRINTQVPEPGPDDETQSAVSAAQSCPAARQFLAGHPPDERAKTSYDDTQRPSADDYDSTRSYTLPSNPLTDFINFFKPGPGIKHPSHPQRLSKKAAKTYHRAQTIKGGEAEADDPASNAESEKVDDRRPPATRGYSLDNDESKVPPPKTSIFDAASDILNPPLPALSWLIDPSKRTRTIFHDRIYHPEDIPAPPVKRPRLSRSVSASSMRKSSMQSNDSDGPDDGTGMRVEEKIARAYHNGMSWRKVLVRLEPDAHNNMIVRRMFANAHGWDVVKHVCDTHFADTYSAGTRDDEESGRDRAQPNKPVTAEGDEVRGQTSLEPDGPPRDRTFSETQEVDDELADLQKPIEATKDLTSSSGASKALPLLRSQSSLDWNEALFDDGDDGDGDDDDDDNEDNKNEAKGPFEAFQRFWQGSPKVKDGRFDPDAQPLTQPAITDHLTGDPGSLESHRGLGTTGWSQPATIHPALDADAVEPLMSETARLAELSPTAPVGSPGGTSELGLKKPPEAHVTGGSPPSSRDGQTNVAQQVAQSSNWQ